jgi:hypothetical protein
MRLIAAGSDVYVVAMAVLGETRETVDWWMRDPKFRHDVEHAMAEREARDVAAIVQESQTDWKARAHLVEDRRREGELNRLKAMTTG